MGKIFGISDLPVSTLHSALEGTRFKPMKHVVKSKKDFADKFISTSKSAQANHLFKMNNRIARFFSNFYASKK